MKSLLYTMFNVSNPFQLLIKSSGGIKLLFLFFITFYESLIHATNENRNLKKTPKFFKKIISVRTLNNKMASRSCSSL